VPYPSIPHPRNKTPHNTHPNTLLLSQKKRLLGLIQSSVKNHHQNHGSACNPREGKKKKQPPNKLLKKKKMMMMESLKKRLWVLSKAL
jgi:hypothetical protein